MRLVSKPYPLRSARALSTSRFMLERATATLLVLLSCLALPHKANAQSFCASDGQPRPTQLTERFLNANCDTCWTDPTTARPAAGTVALDWVVPGSLSDDAPLSAVATRDALLRLEAIKQGVPATSQTLHHPVKGIKGASLRVAHGLPLADYLGVSIELKPIPAAARQPWTAWLALVETLPPGTENSPVERNLVRNVLSSTWDGRKQVPVAAQKRFFETRSMAIAAAANPDRLRVIGWIEDAEGHTLLAAQSRCLTPPD